MGVSKNGENPPKWIVFISWKTLFRWMIWGVKKPLFLVQHPNSKLYYAWDSSCRSRVFPRGFPTQTTVQVDGSERINGDRINGLFHLLINGVYSGYNPLNY